ncbi:MAG: Nudix hydrolase protein [Parcubacteria group bacterium]|nr:Nudix hydrolase protein [Parcubacteria group bacterium]
MNNEIKPKNELPDWAVVVFVFEPSGKTVLVRDPFKPDPVMWKFSGGKRKQAETVLRTAIRELREETGIEAAEKDLELIKEVDKSWHKNPHTVFVFKASVDNFDGLLKFGNEGNFSALEVGVFEISKIPEMKDFFPSHRKYLEEMFVKTT